MQSMTGSARRGSGGDQAIRLETIAEQSVHLHRLDFRQRETFGISRERATAIDALADNQLLLAFS